MRLRYVLAGSLLWLALGPCSYAQDLAFPSAPIRLMVPFPPGGPVDAIGRLIAQKLGAELGQSMYVENKGGAGGGLGAQSVAVSTPTGYQLLLGSTATISILPLVSANVRYDADRDFVPVGVIATGVQIFVVNAKVPVATIPEFVAYAKARSTPVTAAIGGSANPFFVGMFEREAGIKLLQVPYKGTGPSLADVVAGHVEFTVADTSAVLPLLKGGQLKALGISSLTRSALAPEIPTIAEQGYPGFEAGGWFGVFAPSRVPEPVYQRLAAALEKLSTDASLNSQLLQMGLTPSWITGHAAKERVRSENAKFRAVANDMGIKPE